MGILGDALQATRFFTGFMPSFTRMGYQVREHFWVDVPLDCRGQTWVVTGASTGLGRCIASRAAAAGATVWAVARSADRLEDLARSAADGPGRIDPVPRDLALVAETRALIARLERAGQPIDVLVNNVGVLLDRPATTAEGLDAACAVNLVHPWLLTEALADGGQLQRDAVVVTMSSGGMYNVPLQVGRLQEQRAYNGALAYARHKRALVVLNRWWRETRPDAAHWYVMHPGWAATPGVEQSLPLFNQVLGWALRSPEQGADTALWLAQRRPDQPHPGGIWFDRALRDEHLLPGTRDGDSIEELLAALRGCLAAAGADREDRGGVGPGPALPSGQAAG